MWGFMENCENIKKMSFKGLEKRPRNIFFLCLPIAKLDLIGWEKYDAGLLLVDISISILAMLNNIEGQQLKD